MKEIDLVRNHEKSLPFLQQLEEESGQKVGRCYQCMKCTGGCPFHFTMDYAPNMIMRMLQEGLVDEVLESYTIHTCATCATCTARCPRNIDIAKVMDTLRVMAYRQGFYGKGKNMYVFHRAFLNSIKKHGRLYETGLALGLNFGTGRLFQDIDLGLPMLGKGKLSLVPHDIKGRDEVRRLFDYAGKIGE
ncbi:4Fe-4S dicluster domain-containing protein [Thermincola potens]|uniref:Putative heterodisulfide reductase, C subunit n=1 Tax=Thermincola potens (strain JR) TaxID=635013 RepID=D5X7Q6_THEPJ|nr:4Fe-4S dicluster domain-containing protein [Thermincola potens]ADG82626.1 putative heterodisulfide reductase, C subunit [Thermincola potens JR]